MSIHAIREIDPTMSEWPDQLRDMPNPPERLWLRGTGDLRVMLRKAVAIVGSRSATPYGMSVAQEVGHGLAQAGFTVVSGGAYGIDIAAHRGALAARGSEAALVVLACGVDTYYPAGHAVAFDQIANGGLVVAEVPPGSSPTRTLFLARNRIISALGEGTVVVEAATRSGSLNTARHCIEQGKPLFAVPGPVTSIQSAGCHTLLRDTRAILVRNADDVIADLTEED